jgi:hypothetical protein
LKLRFRMPPEKAAQLGDEGKAAGFPILRAALLCALAIATRFGWGRFLLKQR